MTKEIFLQFKDFVTDLIFPKKCIGCGIQGSFLCNNCIDLLVADLSIPECPICRQPSFGGRACQKCVDKSSLDFLWVMSGYDNILVKNIICGIKYDFVTELVVYLRGLIKKYFENYPIGFKNILFVPVPLHRRRRLERGFNQAELICNIILDAVGGIKENYFIRRIRYSFPQAKLSAKDRRGSLHGFFDINTERAVLYNKQKIIVLVDDVYTTGSTMQECAKLLKNAGFQNVGGLVLARGSRG